MVEKLFKEKLKKYIISILVVALASGGGYLGYKNFFAKANAQTNKNQNVVKTEKGNIDVTISGTGTIKPISRYDIVPLVKGNILTSNFEEGESVKAGDLLYKIDDSDLSFNIQKSENSITKMAISNQQTVKSYNNLVVVAPSEGKLTSFTLKQGDQVNDGGKIGDIVNDKKIIATIPFIKSDADKIKIGDRATVQAVSEWASTEGTVKSISASGNYNSDGSVTYNVEIEFDNPGSFVVESTSESVTKVLGDTVTTATADTTVTEVKGTVRTSSGDLTSYYSGSLNYYNSRSALAQASGKVKQIYAKNGDWVTAGQKILELENSNIGDTITTNSLNMKDSQLSLDAQKKQLNDYNITSPIAGTVIKKYYKAGDTINSGTNSTILMTVADLSKMIFSMSVDELDIAKISKGQKVKVTADAITGTSFEGEVTNVSMEGTTSNGVTTYPVEVTISSPGKLMPGMNVNAVIQVESKEDVLYVPVAAVTKVNGKSYVSIAANSSSTSNGQQPSQVNKQNSPKDAANNQAVSNSKASAGINGTMAGNQRVEVVTGVSNDEVIEIVSGLKEGDSVVVNTSTSSTKTNTNTQGGQGGGMGGMMGGPPPG